MGENARRTGVQSVERAIDVLETLARGKVGVSEIVQSTGLPLGTVHRLLATLNDRGYSRQDADRKYSLGPGVLRLVDSGQQSVAVVARPFAQQLTAEFGETANVAVLQGNHVVYVAQSPSPHSLRIFAEVGRRVPLHSTAVGRAILADQPMPVAEHIIAQLDLTPATRYTPATPAALLERLAGERTDGFAIDEQDQEIGVRCVAAKVPAEPSAYIALSISGPAERFTRAAAEAAGPRVVEIAAELGEALNHR